MITDYPSQANYLTKEEAAFVEHRVIYDGSKTPMDDRFSWHYVWVGVTDIKWMINL